MRAKVRSVFTAADPAGIVVQASITLYNGNDEATASQVADTAEEAAILLLQQVSGDEQEFSEVLRALAKAL